MEDFGVVFSAGITCPKHGWSFDLFTGKADHGRYQLKIWETELRGGLNGEGNVETVWVRRKPTVSHSPTNRRNNGRIG